MTWIPPEVAQSPESSTPSNGWIPPEVKKKEEPVSFGGEQSLASPSAATENKQPLTYMQQELRDRGLIVDAPTTKEIKAPQSGSETLKALKSSTARALGGIVGLPNFIEDQIGAFVIKPIMKGIGYSEEEAQQSVDKFKQAPVMGSIATGALSEVAQQQANKYASSIESTMKQYDEGILGSLNNKNYADAGAQIWKGAVQSLPYLAMTAATSGGGTAAVLGTIGTTAAAQRYGELIDPTSKEDKTLSQTGKIANSWAYGGFEAAGELVTAGLLNTVKKAAGQIGKEAAEEIGKGFVKEAAKDFALEGSSEAMTELGQQTTDYLQGLRDNIDFKAIGDVAIIGGVTGVGMAGATTAANKTAKMLAGRKIASDEDVTKVNENNSKIVDLLAEKQKAETPEAANVIDAELASVAKENKDIIDSNEKKAENLTPEQIVKIKDLDNAIDAYDVRIESPSETDNPELLKQIKEKLVLDKQKLVEQATTKKQEPVVIEETKPSEIKPTETASATIEEGIPKEAPIVPSETKEGLKQQKEVVVETDLKKQKQDIELKRENELRVISPSQLADIALEKGLISKETRSSIKGREKMLIDNWEGYTNGKYDEEAQIQFAKLWAKETGNQSYIDSANKKINEKYDAELAALEQQKQLIVEEQQIEQPQLNLTQNGKEGSESSDEAQRRQQETLLVESRAKLEREVKKEENKARLGRIFDNAARLTGARLDITSEEKRTIRKELARDVVDYVKTEFDLLGEALVEKVKSFVKDNNIPLEDISDQELNDVLKEQGYAGKVRKGNQENVGTQKGVVEGTEGKLPVGNDGKDQKTPRGKDEVKQKASKLSSNGKDVIKVGHFAVRLSLEDTKIPQAVKDEIKDKGIGTYTVMSNENAYAIAKSISDSNSLEDLMPIVFSSEVHGGVRGAIMLQVQDRLNKEYYKAEKEGRTEDAKAWASKQVEFYRQFNQSTSNAGSFLQMLGSEKAMESFAPYAHVLKYEQDTQANRKEMQSTTTHKKSLEKTQKASKKAFNDAIDGALNDPKVKKIVAENEGKTINVKPDRLVELRAKEKALIEKLKKSFGKTLTSGGLTKEGIEALGELAVVYVEEAGYHVGNAIKKLIKTAKSIGYTMTEEEALKYMPSKIEGKDIKEKQKEEEIQKAAEQLSNKIFGEVIASKSKEDPLRQMVNTLLGKFKERDLGKEKKQQKTDIQKIADAIKEKYLYADVWNEAKDNAISKIEENKTLDESQKEDAIARVNNAYTKATSFTFTEAQVDRAIRRKMADLNIKVNDVVREFFDIRTAERTKLSDALVEEAGLNKDQARILADAIGKRFDTLMSDSKKKIIEKYVGKIKEGESDVDKITSRQRKDKAAELLELINIGAFDSKEFREAYATAVGIPAINEEHAAVIKNLGEQIAKAKEPFIRHRKVQDLLGYIKSIGGLSPSDMFKSLWYANTLSGIKTEERNVVGGASGVQLAILSDLMLSGRPSAALRGYKKGLSAGLVKAMDVMKEGYAVFDEKSERVDVPNSAEIFQMRKGLFKPIWNNLKYVSRAMNAFDIVNAESGKEAFAHILANEALNVSRWKSLVSSEYRKEVRLLTDKYLKTDKETVDRLKKEIEEDSKEFGYTEREKKLILLNKINNTRPTELSEEASRFGIYNTGNVPSYGTVGMVSDMLATGLKKAAITYYDPKTGKKHTFAPLSLFAAFTKISGNVGEKALNFFLPIAVYRAHVGGYGSWANVDESGKNPLSKYYRELTPRERKTVIGQGILGTIAMVGLYALSSPDDEGKSKFRITANGTGDYKKNAGLTDWQEYSIGFTDDNGKTTWISYKNTPLILSLGLIGYMRDAKQYRDAYRDVSDVELFARGTAALPSFLGDMAAVGSMTKVYEDVMSAKTDRSIMPLIDNVGNTIKGFYTPALYKDAVDIMEQTWDVNVDQRLKGASQANLESQYRRFAGRNPVSIIKKIVNKDEIISAVDVYGRRENRVMPPSIVIKMDDDPSEIDKVALYHQRYANVPSKPEPNATTFQMPNEDGSFTSKVLDLNDMRQAVLWHTFITKRGELILDAIRENMDLKDQEYRDAIEPAIIKATQEAKDEIEMELMDQPLK